jgi:hypothetical protein
MQSAAAMYAVNEEFARRAARFSRSALAGRTHFQTANKNRKMDSHTPRFSGSCEYLPMLRVSKIYLGFFLLSPHRWLTPVVQYLARLLFASAVSKL